MQPALLRLSVCLKWSFCTLPPGSGRGRRFRSSPRYLPGMLLGPTKAGCLPSSQSSKHQQMNLPTLQRESNKQPHSISLTIPWFEGFQEVTETYLLRSENPLGRDPPSPFLPLADSNSSLCVPRRFQTLILTTCSTSNKQT
ncbi:hypothetical protein ATANTOWER_001763 [Ataeniobius toweri]|uniref:Uncharacterized protein n=1 Tax=Ataeniobius toweri TaxID=208326 RepID=A0ABU7A4Q7_9TELE|nr:hypothetical protein [Ataeniobius toweri]